MLQICCVAPGQHPRHGEDAAVDGTRLVNAYATNPHSVFYHDPKTNGYIFPDTVLSKECAGWFERAGFSDTLPDR